MSLEKIPLSGKILLATNLFTLLGVFLFGWNPANIVTLFWAENLVIGFYHIFKLGLNQYHTEERRPFLFRALSIPFFIFHFGMFCAIHGMFLIQMFLPGLRFMPSGDVHILMAVIPFPLFYSFTQGMILAVVAMLISHGFSFYWYYVRQKEYESISFVKLMRQPYERVFVMQIVIIVGSFAAIVLGLPSFVLVILVFVKAYFDLQAHLKEHGITTPIRELLTT